MELKEFKMINPYNEMFLGDPSDIDTFHKYWMSVVDVRGKYLSERQDFLMSGGGYY